MSFLYLDLIGLGNWLQMLDNGPHLSRGTFCPLWLFVLGAFCPLGRFIPWDVLSLGTFCPLGRFVRGTFCLRTLCLRTFLLRTFCLYIEFGMVLGIASFRIGSISKLILILLLTKLVSCTLLMGGRGCIWSSYQMMSLDGCTCRSPLTSGMLLVNHTGPTRGGLLYTKTSTHKAWSSVHCTLYTVQYYKWPFTLYFEWVLVTEL